MMTRLVLTFFLVSLLTLGGCSKGGTKPDEEAAAGEATAGDGDYSSQSGLETGTVGAGGAYVEPGMEPGDEALLAVRQALMLQGVNSVQITTVSYGEERPADSRSFEDAWAKNRRVEIAYSE
jgi:hypothetical protein